MAFDIDFIQSAADQVRSYPKSEQKVILDAIAEQLSHEPTKETKNRKPLRKNELSDWELRVERFRVFYDVIVAEGSQVVRIKAVGHKEHNKLYIAGKEVDL